MFSELAVKITAITKDFESSIKNAQKTMQDVGTTVNQVGKGMSTFVTGPIVALGAGFLALATQTGNYADRILDLSAITGMSTDAIQEFQNVAKIAGVSLESVTAASSKLTRQMTELQTGTGKNAEALAELGIEFTNLEKMSPDERMKTLIDALANIEDPANRARLGTDLLKNSWQDIAPIVALGSVEIDKARQATRDMGAVMGIDALNNANNFRIGMENLKTEFRAAGQGIMTEFIPILTDDLMPFIKNTVIPKLREFAEMISNVFARFRELSPETQATIGKIILLVAAIGPALQIISKLITIVKSLSAALLFLNANPVGAIIIGIAALIAIGVLLYKNWDTVSIKLKQIFNTIKLNVSNAMSTMKIAVLNGVKSILDAVEKLADRIPFLSGKVKGLSNDIQKMINEEEVKKANRTLQNEIIQSGLAVDMQRIQTEKLSISQNKLNKDTENLGKATSNLSEAKIKDVEYTEKNIKTTEQLAEAQKIAAENAKRAKDEMLADLNKLGDATISALKTQYDQQEKLQRNSIERTTDAIRQQTDNRIKEYEREYKAKLKLIDDETNEQINGINIQIENINNLTKTEDKAKKEQEYISRLLAEEKNLTEAKSAKTREEIQNRINKMITEREREQTLEQRQIQIDALRLEINNIRDQSSLKKELAIKEFEDRKNVAEMNLVAQLQYLKNEQEAVRMHFEILRKQENIEAEARRLMLNIDNKKLIDLLETYNPKWQDAGANFAESLLKGLRSKNQSIQDEVKSMLQFLDKNNTNVELFPIAKISTAPMFGDRSGIQSPSFIINTQSMEELPKMSATRLGNAESQTNIYLDGREITRTIAPHMVDMIRAKGVMA
jgi:hypothetical protein